VFEQYLWTPEAEKTDYDSSLDQRGREQRQLIISKENVFGISQLILGPTQGKRRPLRTKDEAQHRCRKKSDR